ncbi:MAG: hypothetical protein EA398_05505 [Deltaproteobacteria bacterium]|nr:MAG: hypothetical protein EA398_05505 [Deltaproteobacteria bacterium]
MATRIERDPFVTLHHHPVLICGALVKYIHTRLFIALLVPAFAMLAACGDDDNGGADPESSTEVPPTGVVPSDIDSDACTPSTTEEGRAYRIEGLAISQPGTLSLLQGLIDDDIDEGLLNVLIVTRNFEDCPGGVTRFEITGNAADPTDGEAGDAPPSTLTYTWSDSVESVEWRPAIMQSDRSFVNTETLDLLFPALLPPTGDETEPTLLVLPLKNISIEGLFTEIDGVAAIAAADGGARLTGAILEEDADGIEFELAGSMRELPSLLGTKNYPSDASPADRTGWNLRARVAATEVAFEDRP